MDVGAWAFVSEMLSRPFEFSDLKTRSQWSPGGTIYLLYIDSRIVQERLDEVVGAQNWEVRQRDVSIIDTSKIDITPADAPRNNKGKPVNPVYEFKEVSYGGIETTLTLFGVSKSDVGNASMAEQIKGAYSDGLKRAAVMWGIGRYLYEIKNNKAENPSERTMPDFAIPYEAPDFDEAIGKLQVNIARHLKHEKMTTEFSNKIIETIRALMSENYDTNAPLVYKRFTYTKLVELEKIVKGVIN